MMPESLAGAIEDLLRPSEFTGMLQGQSHLRTGVMQTSWGRIQLKRPGQTIETVRRTEKRISWNYRQGSFRGGVYVHWE